MMVVKMTAMMRMKVTIMMFLVVAMAFQNGVDCEKLMMKVNPILHFPLCSETP